MLAVFLLICLAVLPLASTPSLTAEPGALTYHPGVASLPVMWRLHFLCAASHRCVTASEMRCYSTPGKIKVNMAVQDGTELDFETPTGITLMEAIRDVAQLDMDVSCNKLMRCSICDVYLAPEWYAKLPAPTEEELDVLDQAIEPRETSRLSCQVHLTADHDGIDVTLPKKTVDLTLK